MNASEFGYDISDISREVRSKWGSILASGCVTLAAGIIFVMGWPINTLWLLGMMLAVDLTFQGISAIGFGLALKSIR